MTPNRDWREPRDLATNLLNDYFSLHQYGLGQYQTAAMAYGGWTLEDQILLGRLLAEGCRELPKIVANNSSEALNDLCSRLYDMAEMIPYPAVWAEDGHDLHWRRFWDSVAQILSMPPRYGVPFSRVETREEAHARIYFDAERRDLLQRARFPRLAALIARVRGPVLPLPDKCPEKAGSPTRSFIEWFEISSPVDGPCRPNR